MARREIRKHDKCEYPHCSEDADTLVYSNDCGEVMKCCYHHIDSVLLEMHPEYTEVCANCNCYLPIN